jgi:alanine-synthesizing transaminase
LKVVPAQRIERLKYAIRNVANAAAGLESEGRRILYLNIGDPLLYDFETPAEMIEATERAMRDGKNYYGPSAGILQAREAIAESLEAAGIDVAPGDVFVTSGASEAIDIAMTALLEPGDNVLTPLPGYPLYSATLTKLSAEERSYRLDPDNRWQPDLEHVESLIDGRTRALVVINPNNPTGSVCDEEVLRGLVDIARRHSLVLFADEVYHNYTYGPPPPRLAAVAGDVPVVAFDSLSKAYLATGWRVGWMTLHGTGLRVGLKGAITRLVDARLCGPTPPQFAVPVALAGGKAHLAETMNKLRARRDVTVERLASIPGFSCTAPEAAFYVMPRFSGLDGKVDEDFVLDLLTSEGVLAVHGSGFGMPAESGYMRIVFLAPVPTLETAFDGIERVATRWQAGRREPHLAESVR